MPAPIAPRLLRDILMDITLRDKPVTKALAEEAVRSVAADGVITQAEVDALEPYGDGVRDSSRIRAHESSSWKEGTQAGRALFNGLSNAVESIYAGGNFESRRHEPAPSFNPFGWWMGGWAGSSSSSFASDQPVAVTAARVLQRTREGGTGWVHSDFEAMLERYPKATSDRNSEPLTPRPEVQTAYDKLKADWMRGKVTDERDLMADLKPLLDAKYR